MRQPADWATESVIAEVRTAYEAETRALIATRFPIAGALFLAFMTIAYVIEWLTFPARWAPLSLCYAVFVAIVLGGQLALRRWPDAGRETVLLASVGLAFSLATYLALAHRTDDLTLLAMIGFLTGEVVQFPWGARGQSLAALAAFAAYLWALQLGAVPVLPLPYALFALASHATMTVLGAHLLEAYRFAAFREARESARHAAESARASAAKSEFLATVSHELRTPLNIIVGYTDLLLEGAFPTLAEQHDTLGRIHHQSRQLLDLIQSMLDLNRVEAGGISLVYEDFPIAAALDNLRSGLPDAWCRPGVTLRWETEAAAAAMRSDRGKIELILRNLVHNALKYTSVGSVTVRALADPARGQVDFSVIDTGDGIAPEDLSGIFDMFRQGSNGPPRGGGVGLGLYLVKRLTDALGGTVAVESVPGAGSHFRVSLPLVHDEGP
ncbi:MAG: HAMP domain-containing sensor histidine kinase [Candidatus Binatia bacterium]